MKKIFIFSLLGSFSFFNAQNLILNGSFEDWSNSNPVHWFKSGDDSGEILKSDTVKKEGNSGLEVKMPIYNGVVHVRGTNQGGLVNGETYVFSGWYLDNGSGVLSAVAKFFESDDITLLSGSTDSAEWQYFEVTQLYSNEYAEDDKVRIDLTFNAQNNNTLKPSIFVDDLKIMNANSLSVQDAETFKKEIKLNTLVKDVLYLQLPHKCTVNLYDVTGRLLFSKRLSENTEINFNDFEKGNYFLVIKDEKNTVKKKIIKQ